jgi:hypothetical protein
MSDVIASIGVIAIVYGAVIWYFISGQAALAERNGNGTRTDREQDEN